MENSSKERCRKMTLEQKASLCSGLDFWHTKENKDAGISEVTVADGPHGLRKQGESMQEGAWATVIKQHVFLPRVQHPVLLTEV